MNNRETVIIVSLVGLGLLILLTAYNLNSTIKLNNEIARLQGETRSLHSQISSELGRVSRDMWQVKEESRWWSPGETEVLETEPDQALVKVGWYLREYREGSTVAINYRRQGDDYYNVMEAEGGGSGGYFFAVLPIELPKEPVWHHYASVSRTDVSSHWSEGVVEEKYAQFEQELQYQYYISTDDQGTIRTGDVENLNLYKLSRGLYSNLDSDLHIHGNNINVHLRAYHGYPEPLYILTEAHLECRKGSRVIRRWPLLEQEYEKFSKILTLNVKAEPGVDYSSLFLVVTYSDGSSFEKETKF